MKVEHPVTADAALAQAAELHAQEAAERMELEPGQEAEILTLAVPWPPVVSAGSGLAMFCLAMTFWQGQAAGLALACLGIFVSAVGVLGAVGRSLAIRRQEHRTPLGNRLSSDNTNQASRHL